MASRLLSRLPWLSASIMLVSGVGWRNCVLVASAVLLAIQAFYKSMDAGAPWDEWRAAVRCWLAGVGAMAAAIGLSVMIAGTVLDWWLPGADRSEAALILLVLVGGATAVGQVGHRHAPSDASLGLLATGAAIAATLLARQGVPYALCIFAGVAGIATAYVGWHLAHHTARRLASPNARF